MGPSLFHTLFQHDLKKTSFSFYCVCNAHEDKPQEDCKTMNENITAIRYELNTSYTALN